MRYSFAALVGLLAAQQAAACDTCDWNAQPGLPSCQNSCNECTKEQQQGIDFSSLPSGNIGVVAGLQFSGCSIGAFAGVSVKRDYSPRGMIKRWGSDSNCATGSLSHSSGPSFSCTGDTKAVSVNQVHLSVEHDTPVQLTYHYDTGANAGKTCTQTAQCSAGQVNQIQNTQCGGAHRVECALPPSAPKPSCSVGIHSIGFDCSKCSSTPAPPTPPKSKTPPPPPPKSVAPPPPPPLSSAPAPPPSSPAPPPSSSAPAAPPSSSAPAPPPSSSAPAAPPSSSAPAPPPSSPAAPPSSSAPAPPPSSPAPPPSSPQAPSTTPTVAPTSSPPPPSLANSSTPVVTSAAGSTVEVYTSEVVYTTITSCPVTHPNGQVHTDVSTVLITSTKTICTKCIAPPHTKKPLPPPPSPTPSSTPAESPSTPAESPSSTPAESPSSTPAESPSTPAETPSSTPAESPSSSPVESPSSTPSSPSPAVSDTSSATSPVSPATTTPPQSTLPVVTSEIVYTTVTSCPVTHPNGQVTTILSTVQVTSTSTICTNCVAPPPPPPPSSPPAAPPAPSGVKPPAPVQPSSAPQSSPPAPAPSVLPNCLQTWLSLTKCKDNSDADCFCQNQSFTSNVQECISAWSQSPDEQQAALKYLAGICAPHVSANPQVVAPITPAPSAAAASSSGPMTTISISTTITVACPSDAAVKQISDGQVQAGTAAGSCTTTQVINKQVAVPQVAFSTSASAVGLVAGTPAPAAAAATPAAPASSPSSIPAAAAPSSTSPVSPASTAQAASPADTGVASFKGAASKVGQSSLLFTVAAILVGFVAL